MNIENEDEFDDENDQKFIAQEDANLDGLPVG